jgi:hypothetical protein
MTSEEVDDFDKKATGFLMASHGAGGTLFYEYISSPTCWDLSVDKLSTRFVVGISHKSLRTCNPLAVQWTVSVVHVRCVCMRISIIHVCEDLSFDLLTGRILAATTL